MRRVLIAVVIVALATSGVGLASDMSREPAHSPNYANDSQFPAPQGTSRAPFFSENFDGTWPPAGWTVVDNVTGGSGTTWNLNTSFSDHNGNYTGGSGTCAMACSDCTDGTFDVELHSPVIDCSAYQNVALSFDVNYQNYANYDNFGVDVSADGGTTWTNVLTWNEDHGTQDATPGEHVMLDISSVAGGQSQVMIRFHYWDLRSGAWDWYVQVDDVEVAEVKFAVPALSGTGIALFLVLMAGAAVLVIRRHV